MSLVHVLGVAELAYAAGLNPATPSDLKARGHEGSTPSSETLQVAR